MRLAGSGDLDHVAALTRAAYAIHEGLDQPPLPVSEDYAPRIARGEVWLAGVDGLIVIETHADHLLVFSIAVRPQAHGTGTGRQLMAFAEERARAGGHAEVRLYTNALWERNISFYKRLGYRETGRRKNPLRQGWILVDMAKSLT
ncbi:MAG: GNAT family N-acetyltransferase [Rhodospirillales bacterium]|nr:GNAT family N-acetyltransferase [Rhodospirillales bacterium]